MGIIIQLAIWGVCALLAFNFGSIGMCLALVIFFVFGMADTDDYNFFRKEK